MTKLFFPAYSGGSFLDYLLESQQAERLLFDDDGLTIYLTDKYDRLSKKQKTEVIKAKLLNRAQRPPAQSERRDSDEDIR